MPTFLLTSANVTFLSLHRFFILSTKLTYINLSEAYEKNTLAFTNELTGIAIEAMEDEPDFKLASIILKDNR